MADQYSEATVNTNIPADLVSDVEKELLQALGYECEPMDLDGNYLYFFQQESGSGLEIADLNLFLQKINTLFPEEATRPAWATRLLAHISESTVDGDNAAGFEVDFNELPPEIEAEHLFQGILNKPGNSGQDAIDEVIIMGAYYCSKMRQHQFGGWVSRVTRDRIETENTGDLLNRLRRGQDDNCIKPDLFYAAASALSRLHDLFTEIVDEGRVNWVSESEHESVLAALGASNTALSRTD